jgi:hypothetical protein
MRAMVQWILSRVFPNNEEIEIEYEDVWVLDGVQLFKMMGR